MKNVLKQIQVTYSRDLPEKILHLLKQCNDKLIKWNRLKQMSQTVESKLISKRLNALQEREDPTVIGEIKEVQRELNHLMEWENLQWKPRAKSHWHQDGNRSTNFFHTYTIQRQQKSYICKLITKGNGILENENMITKAF